MYTIPTERACEEVLHLLRDSKSPWKITDDWSGDAVWLRELIATTFKGKFTNDFFYTAIKSLRLTCKNVRLKSEKVYLYLTVPLD